MEVKDALSRFCQVAIPPLFLSQTLLGFGGLMVHFIAMVKGVEHVCVTFLGYQFT
jgi:hypothetical protein